VAETASRNKVLLARLVVALMIGFAVLGFALNGFSAEVLGRIWHNMTERPGGPMTFRFILQPIMVTIAAFYDGVADARGGRKAYLAALVTDPAERSHRLREGLIATARVLLLGLVMDLIYQYIVFDAFRPAEAVIISVLLAFVPYLLLRGPIARVARWWLGKRAANDIH